VICYDSTDQDFDRQEHPHLIEVKQAQLGKLELKISCRCCCTDNKEDIFREPSTHCMHAHTHARTYTHAFILHIIKSKQKRRNNGLSIYFEIIVNMMLRTSPRPGLQPPVPRDFHARLAFSPVRERVHCPARGRKAGRALRTQAFLWWPGSRVSAKSISCTIVRGGLPGVCRHFSLHEQFTGPTPSFMQLRNQDAPGRNHV